MKVLICAIVKNAAKNLHLNLHYARETCKAFAKAHIVIYENNSTDGTKEILKSQKSSELTVISEDLLPKQVRTESKIWTYQEVTGSDHPCRIEQISKARNKVLEEINQKKYDDYDFVLWVDFDSKGWEVAPLVKALQYKDQWDVCYGNSNPYYDFYALRTEENPFGPEILGQYWWNHLPQGKFNPLTWLKKKFPSPKKVPQFKPVLSAFNGIGLYHKRIFRDFIFDFQVNEEVKKFYRGYYHKLKNPELKKLIEQDDTTFPGGLKDEASSIIWKNNSGYQGLVICEHVCFNFALQNHGYRVCMNKDMMYYP